jgi:pimeloyl-ACP methyl ester carboxylesterase
VGQSWGASVVLELGARHPEAVRAVVLVDGGTMDLADGFADWESCEAALMPPILAGTPAVVVQRRLRAEHPDWTVEGIAATMANLEVLRDGTVTARLPSEDHRRILRLLWEHRPALVYPGVTVPVLLVPAQDEEASTARFMPMKREQVSRAEAGLARSATRWVTGDHDLHVQHPDLLAGLVAQVARGELP